jgi:hypothetical protein
MNKIILFDVIVFGRYYAVKATIDVFKLYDDLKIFLMACDPICPDVQFAMEN